MSARQPRFEICRGDDGWWARFRAANGRVVWVTETYRRRRGAAEAIRGLPGVKTTGTSIASFYSPDPNSLRQFDFIEVREVDER